MEEYEKLTRIFKIKSKLPKRIKMVTAEHKFEFWNALWAAKQNRINAQSLPQKPISKLSI